MQGGIELLKYMLECLTFDLEYFETEIYEYFCINIYIVMLMVNIILICMYKMQSQIGYTSSINRDKYNKFSSQI